MQVAINKPKEFYNKKSLCSSSSSHSQKSFFLLNPSWFWSCCFVFFSIQRNAVNWIYLFIPSFPLHSTPLLSYPSPASVVFQSLISIHWLCPIYLLCRHFTLNSWWDDNIVQGRRKKKRLNGEEMRMDLFIFINTPQHHLCSLRGNDQNQL